MDGSAFRNLKLDGLVWWAIIGMSATAVGALIAVIALIWFVTNHVRVV